MNGNQKNDLFQATPYQTLEEVAENSSTSTTAVDGIICCTPTLVHSDIIRQAAQHKWHIFCEKPVAESATKILEMFDLAEASDVQLCCGFQRRFDPSYRQALEMVVQSGDKTIGQPIGITAFFGDHPEPPKEFLLQGGADIFEDLCVHDVDYILQALPGQDIVRVYATATSSTAELEAANVHDNATMMMKFSGGK